jgi:acetolactate synthase-1/2/3 large subunit
MWEAQYYKHDQPRTLITSGGLGTMGFALPAGIGAKVACPEKKSGSSPATAASR